MNCEPTIKNLRMIAKKTLRIKTKECNHKNTCAREDLVRRGRQRPRMWREEVQRMTNRMDHPRTYTESGINRSLTHIEVQKEEEEFSFQFISNGMTHLYSRKNRFQIFSFGSIN
jgi:hypothetical protein